MMSATENNKPAGDDGAHARLRLKGFGNHMIGYFVVMIVLVPLNFWLTPDRLWFLLPMVGWGAVLALHAAYAMGLFGVFERPSE